MPSQAATQENSATGVIPTAPWRIQAVSVLPNLQLAITFCDGLTGIADFSAVEKSAQPGVYAPLANSDFFSQVQIELGALTWPNGADIDPVWLHDNLARDKTWSVPF